MAIVPAGKTRLMVSQVISNPTLDSFNNGEPQIFPEDINTDEAITEDIAEVPGSTDLHPEQGMTGIKQKSKPTLTDYIFNTLEKLGYPGRRLEEFKKKFVKETVSPDGTKDIKVEIPDRYYPDERGHIKTVETDELGKIVEDINQKFGLNFNGAERSEGKWIIDLTSAKKQEEGDEQSIVKDNLDEIYGTPSGSKQKKERSVKAFSQRELISASKSEELLEKLKKINGENNAS